MLELLDAAVASERVVLSVMGPHAGEGEETIFSRKIEDVSRIGQTFWLCRSPAAAPSKTRPFFGDRERAYALFLAPASPKGARPTTVATRATAFSENKLLWQPLPQGISPVTGHLGGGSYAFVLSQLELCAATIDLWRYTTRSEPVRFRLGASTLLAEVGDSSAHPARAKSRYRRVLAVAELVQPFAVWVR